MNARTKTWEAVLLKTLRSGRCRKIYARNAYERRLLHIMAEERGLLHITMFSETEKDKILTMSARTTIAHYREELSFCGRRNGEDREYYQRVLNSCYGSQASYDRRSQGFVQIGPRTLLQSACRMLPASLMVIVCSYLFAPLPLQLQPSLA